MRNYPRFSEHGSRSRREHGYEPRETPDTGATLWIAAAAVIVALAALLFFNHDKLNNGGAPFIISPAGQSGAVPATGL